MSKKDFLLEIGCEELPPKLLQSYAEALLLNLQGELEKALVSYTGTAVWFAAPRRLAVLISDIALTTKEQAFTKTGPAVNAAHDSTGKPTPALLGFAKSCNVSVEQLTKTNVGGVEKYCYQATIPAKNVTEVLPSAVNEAVKKLPIAKPMRWGNGTAEFIRPVHWVLMLLGSDVVAAEVLSCKTDRITYAHRFMAPEAIKIKQASDYVSVLAAHKVLVDFEARKSEIKKQVEQQTKKLDGEAVIDLALLDEVTAIVEWPVALTGHFDEKFLTVPQEALMSAMQHHQKSFPVVDKNGKILPHFIFVSNLESKQPQAVITGNEKVMRARLSDAAFFYETDLKLPLAAHLDSLKNVVFQAGLGSLYERSLRIAKLAALIAEQIEADSVAAYRAGELSKCDLMTAMVGEFPELQGTMGYYYALKSNEPNAVAIAIHEQYQPAFAGDFLPSNSVSACVALAEKIDTLVGIFGINQKPTGSKDPFGLRRAAIGVVRILIEKQLPLDLIELLNFSAKQYPKLPNQNTVAEVKEYILERLKAWYVEQGIAVNLYNAIANNNVNCLVDFATRLKVVNEFMNHPACTQLAAANKRVVNILSKEKFTQVPTINEQLLAESAEKNLYQAILQKQKQVEPLLVQQDYAEVLTLLAELQTPVDQFFEQVMVNAEDAKIKANRLGLLWQLRTLLNSVADLSCL